MVILINKTAKFRAKRFFMPRKHLWNLFLAECLKRASHSQRYPAMLKDHYFPIVIASQLDQFWF